MPKRRKGAASRAGAKKAPASKATYSPPKPIRIGRWIFAILAVAFFVRLPGMFTAFWLDEIWTWELVEQVVRSPMDVFTKIHLDGNHPLNTLLMYCMGTQAPLPVYRIPALLAGIGTVILAGRFALRRGRAHALATAGVMALSFPLVVYSSEARGYAPGVFFALVLVDATDQYLLDLKYWRCVVIGLAVVLGSLSQPTFVIPYGAVGIWSLCELFRQGRAQSDWKRAAKALLACHAGPMVFVIAYFAGYVLRLGSAGAEKTTVAIFLQNTISFAMGFGSGVSANLAGVILGALLAAGAVVVVARRWPMLLSLLLPGILLLPAAVLVFTVARGQEFLYPRYLLMSIALLLLTLGLAIGELWEGPPASRFIAIVIAAGFAVMNLVQDYRFSAIGRGDYAGAIRYMIANTPGNEISVAGNQDFRTQALLLFHGSRIESAVTIHYVEHAQWEQTPPDWYIENTSDPHDAPAVGVIGQIQYLPVRTFPAYGPSGVTWVLFQRVGK